MLQWGVPFCPEISKITKQRTWLFLGMSGEKMPQFQAIPVLSQGPVWVAALFPACSSSIAPYPGRWLSPVKAIGLISWEPSTGTLSVINILHVHTPCSFYRAGTEQILYLPALMEIRTILERSKLINHLQGIPWSPSCTRLLHVLSAACSEAVANAGQGIAENFS